MLFGPVLPFVGTFIEAIDEAIQQHDPRARLSRAQRAWLGFCIMGILVTNAVSWAHFERASLRAYTVSGLSWMFRHSKIPWPLLLPMSTRVILRRFGITEGVLVLDDTDKQRSKTTKRIAKVHKLKDKATGGFFMGQSLVVLLLVTETVTLPVGFAFYLPDPALSTWYKQDKQRKKQGLPPQQPKPPKNPLYPSKLELALSLLGQFKHFHPTIKVKAILADALYGTSRFLDAASALFDGAQVISQLRSNQKVGRGQDEVSLEAFFAQQQSSEDEIALRGGLKQRVKFARACLYVRAHGKKRLVIALKYEGEDQYRYLVASDMGWRSEDVIAAYLLRWLIEVFFQDWKAHEGWAALTQQMDEEGSDRSLILSLLLDQSLLVHPTLAAQLENKLPAYSVGSLIGQIKVEALLGVIGQWVTGEHAQAQLAHLSAVLERDCFKLNASKKHLSGRKVALFEAQPAVELRRAA